MVDPIKITDFNLSVPKLEEVLLFWVCAAGKNAMTAARGLEAVLTEIGGKDEPFKTILEKGKSNHRYLPNVLKKNGIGCYNNKACTFFQLALHNLDLKTCTVNDLQCVYGIGPKTARCFLMHSRKDARCAGLDTHVLKFMKDLGYDVPSSTPSGKKYLKIEKQFLELVDLTGMSVAEMDLLIWRIYSGKCDDSDKERFDDVWKLLEEKRTVSASQSGGCDDTDYQNDRIGFI
jgi:thermostable 8-oxoguanine DNA glycosylase